MRQSSRRFLASSLVTCLVLLSMLLAACGGGGPGAASPTAPSDGQAQATQPPATEPPADEPPAATEPTAEETPEEAPPAAGDKLLRIAQDAYPEVLDPQKSSFTHEIGVLSLIYEGLTRLDENLETAPAAAEKWEFSEDGKTITFTLRADMKYSDGEPLTAENFEAALRREADPETAGEYQSIVYDIVGAQELAETPVTDTAALEEARANLGVEAVDDQTLVIQLKQPAPYFPKIMGLWVTYPVRQDVIEPGGDTWHQQAQYHVGNGPFKITSISERQLITFEANENYWQGRPKLDGIEYIYIQESAVAFEEYRNGNLDILEVDPSLIPQAEADPQLSQELLKYPSASTFNLALNLTKEPFTDKKVREAFSYAFDRQTYCEQVRSGDCIPTLSWVPGGVPGSIETDKYGFDPEKAKQALAESSYGGAEGLPPVTFSFYSDDPAERTRAEYIAGMFRDVLGVNVELEPVERTTLIARRKDPENFPHMVIGGWIQDYPDPQNWLSVYWTCDSTFAQRFHYCNEQFDELTNKADVEQDEAQRVQYYEQAGQLLVDDVPGPFLYNLANVFLVKPYVQGYKTTSADSEWPGQWASQLTIDVTE